VAETSFAMYERESRREREPEPAPAPAPEVVDESAARSSVLAPPAPIPKERPEAKRTELAAMVMSWQQTGGNRAVAAMVKDWEQAEEPATPEAETPEAGQLDVISATADLDLRPSTVSNPVRGALSNLMSSRAADAVSDPVSDSLSGPVSDPMSAGGPGGGTADTVAASAGESPPDMGTPDPSARDAMAAPPSASANGDGPDGNGSDDDLRSWLGSFVGRLETPAEAPSDAASAPKPVSARVEVRAMMPQPAEPAAAQVEVPAVVPQPSEPAPTLKQGFPEKQRPAPPGGGAAGAPGGEAAEVVATAAKAAAPAGGKGAGGKSAGAGGKGAGGKSAGGGGSKGGGGGGKPALHDPTLEKWRAAAGAAVEAAPAGDLGDAKDGPKAVADSGKAVSQERKSSEPDFEADAKSKQPPMPQEPKKEEYLDTAPADAAVAKVKQTGERKLTTQTLSEVGAPPVYPGLNPRDYVPKNLLAAITDLEKRLEGLDLSPGDRAKLTAELEKRKKDVAAIEERAKAGPAKEVPVTVVDSGPASLEPLDAGKADVLGDAIANLLAQVDGESQKVVDKAVASLKGAAVPKLLAAAKEKKPSVQTELDRELRGIAEAAGVTAEQLTAKIAEQKATIKKEADGVNKGVETAGADAAKAVQDVAKERDTKIAGAATAVKIEVAKKQQAVDGPPDTAAIERKRDEYVTKVQQAGAQAAAGAKAALTKRENELDKAGGTQKAAAKAAADNQAAAIRRKWAEDSDKTKSAVESLPTNDWGRRRMGEFDGEVSRLKVAAKVEADSIAAAIATQVTSSKDAVRDWAARQQGRERSWWDKLMDRIRDWSSQATANNEAWERQRNAESRDQMAGDLDALTRLREAQVTRNAEALQGELTKMDAEQRQLAALYLQGGISSIGFVAQSTMQRISSRRVPELAEAFESDAIASWNWEDLGQLAKGKNPGFDPGKLGNQIRGAIAGWGTDEAKAYTALGGAKTPVERAALSKFYVATFKVTLESDIKGDFSGAELDRAMALMHGKSAEADAAALKEAVRGWGTDEKAIKEALRGKSPEELEAIKAEYLRMYKVPLLTDLEGDLSGAELDNALALARGDSTAADAAELEDAMAGLGTDEKQLKKVYERIREEEEQRARRDGISPAELEARIRERNSSLKQAYEAKYGNLASKLDSELGEGDLKLMQALQSGSPAEIDAARAFKEHKDFYASDDELEAITRNQHKRAERDVALEIAAEQARIAALRASGDITPDEAKRLAAELDARKKAKDAEITARSHANMEDLRKSYLSATDNKQSFDQLILEETSGYSQLEIQDLVAMGGKLSDEDEIYYAIAGVGTDEDKIKEILADKTPAQIAEIRARYEKKHGEGSFDRHILGDLSGRDDLDIGHTLKYGDISTFPAQLEAAKNDPEKRKQLLADMKKVLDERRDFEKSGVIGMLFDDGLDPMNSADQLARAVARLDQYNAMLDSTMGKEDKDLTAEELAELAGSKANLEMNYSAAIESQVQVRAQIDSYTDVIAQVGAAILGVAVTIATAGTAGLAVAALYGALAAVAATMALKQVMKGAAYSWEETGVDLAVGAVDAIISVATAGIGKSVTTAMRGLLAAQVAKRAAKEGAEAVSESMAKKWIKEALEEIVGEAFENAFQAAPSAFVAAMLDDNVWGSDDPWGAIAAATGTGAAVGAGIGVGAKVGGDALGKIKGKLSAEPTIDIGGGQGAGSGPAPKPDAPAPKPDAPAPKPDAPAPKPDTDVKIPPEADPSVAAKKAADGQLPSGVSDADVAAASAKLDGDSPTTKPTGDDVVPATKLDDAPPVKSGPDADAPPVKSGADADGPPVKSGPDADGPPVKPGPDADGPPVKSGADADGPPVKSGADADGPAVVVAPPAKSLGDVEPVTPVAPGPKKGKPHADDVGKPLSDDDLATRYGMPKENVDKIAKICDAEGVIVDVRPTTAHAEPMLREGTALPKPEKLKAKTINEIDVMIGCGSEADLGKVGFFRPAQIDRPPNFDTLPADLKVKIDERIAQRLEEIADYWQDMQKLIKAGQIEIRADGVVINTGLTPGGKEVPFTGDHDIFDIRNKDGSALSPEKYQAVKAKLMAADAGVMHGGVTGWEIDSPQTFNTEAGQKSYGKMVEAHTQGGKEPLVRIGDGQPTAVWYTPATPAAPTKVDGGKVPE
jgi:hypothetical protein